MVAFASDPVTIEGPVYRRYVIDSRQLDACRVRESAHIDQLEHCQGSALRLRGLLTTALDDADEVDAKIVAQVETLTEALAQSERRRGRLRTAGAVVLGVVVGVVVGAVVR